MASKSGWRSTLLYVFAFSSLLSAYVHIGVDARQDRSWKRYRNASAGYCVSYPSRWIKGDAFDGAGLFVETGLSKFSKPLGEIDLGPLPLPQQEDARIKPISLSEDLKLHLDGLQKFVRAERMEVLEKRDMQFHGNSALYTKNRYYDPLERATWMEEVLFVKYRSTLFRLELQCQANQLERFEPVFTYLLSTFEFDCPKQ